MRHLKSIIIIALLVATFAGQLMARTKNGNDFALYYSEARNDMERADLLKENKGDRLLFRYLQIIKMEKLSKNGRAYMQIVAFEPSSFLDVKFFVTQPVCLKKLWAEPVTKVGDAIAVTGVLRKVDFNEIEIHPVIVRHKDKLLPGRGKEYLYEVDKSSVFYSYTGGDTAVHLSFQDRDLLRHQSRVMQESGKQGWTDFLLKEKAKRDKARAKAAKANMKAQIKTHKDDGSATTGK